MFQPENMSCYHLHIMRMPDHCPITAYGFGYDSVSDDYKLILVDEISKFHNVVCVYSMKRNEWVRSWMFSNLIPNLSGVVVKGFVNWVYRKEGKIVAFDLDTEEFRLVPLPNRRRHEYESASDVTVDVLRGCLLMIIPSEREIEMWVMKDYMVKESWTKLYTISRRRSFICPINSNEFLIRSPIGYDYIGLYRYNPVTREEIDVHSNAVNGQTYDTLTVVFVESLVQIRKLMGAGGRPRVRQGKPIGYIK
ncbi:F-box protein CPR30-like isoform X1 [Tripterygium wilfordii]|uniref:F-box protein CPR30-like isoform X1 n=1 Tax=Tripterygium wilfordii TaxID=458696 RepID=A0A7J7D7C3_TRIWF|nr:F-box protein CPR1-like [Tripterygium wilfordii]KAF5742232.1 F-box protein CPR30-like isoform X1 [Tripterygium wilfordii]